MLYSTKGIVLRAVKYGDTSLIVLMYTELFGIQSYIVNGVRTEKKGGTRAGMFQPAAILDMIVYHQDQKNLQRIKEYKWAYLYQQIYMGIIKTTLVMYMMEMLQKCLKQPESNAELYAFIESSLLLLDQADDLTAANYALHFTLALASYLGFRIGEQYSASTPILDLQEGIYTRDQPVHGYYLEGYLSEVTYQLLEAGTLQELGSIRLNRDLRRSLLQAYQSFYMLHVSEFGQLKSLQVLQDILGSTA
jgi:DNA repair protein RecO (recombination protein O)